MIPWKLIFVVLGVVLLLFFVGMNYDHSAEVRLWFGESGVINTNVVYLLTAGFLLGFFVSLPFILKRKRVYIDLSKERIKEQRKEKKRDTKRVLSSSSSPSSDDEVDPYFKSLK